MTHCQESFFYVEVLRSIEEDAILENMGEEELQVEGSCGND